MRIRLFAGRRGHAARPCRRRLGLRSLAFASLFAFGAGVDAGTPSRPIEHHATVINGPLMGSAFLLDATTAVTNAHVVQGVRPGNPVRLVSADGSRSVEASLRAVSGRMDLAVLTAPAGFLRPVSIEDAPRRPGTAVAAAGVDAGRGRGRGVRLQLSGTVSSEVRRLPEFGPGLVARMPGVRHGFSGGPVLDARGRLVGMIAAIRLDGAKPVRSAGSSFSPVRPGELNGAEAFVLDAAEIRAEVSRLVGRR